MRRSINDERLFGWTIPLILRSEANWFIHVGQTQILSIHQKDLYCYSTFFVSLSLLIQSHLPGPLVHKRPENGYGFLINRFLHWEIRTSRFRQGQEWTKKLRETVFSSLVPLKASMANKQAGKKQEGRFFVSKMRIFDELEEQLQTDCRRRQESWGVPTTCLSGCRYTREEGKASKVN